MQDKIIQSVSVSNYTNRIVHSSMRKYPENNLRRLREDRELTQEQLAELVIPPTNHDMIAKLERGHRELTHTWMIRLGRALQCQPEDLIVTDAIGKKKNEVMEIAKKISILQEPEKSVYISMLESLLNKKN